MCNEGEDEREREEERDAYIGNGALRLCNWTSVIPVVRCSTPGLISSVKRRCEVFTSRACWDHGQTAASVLLGAVLRSVAAQAQAEKSSGRTFATGETCSGSVWPHVPFCPPASPRVSLPPTLTGDVCEREAWGV